MAIATGSASRAFSQAAPHVLVIGGGTSGSTATKYLKLENPALRVTVTEPNPQIYRCWGSNEVGPATARWPEHPSDIER